MNANELRIGNLLQGDPLVIARECISSDGIVRITGYGIHLTERGDINYKPILLDDFDMERFGFTYNDLNGSSGFWQIVPPNYGEVFEILEGEESWQWNWRVELRYVHELQNLYFALTGEELILK